MFIMNSKLTSDISEAYTDNSDPFVRACISRGFYPKASDKIMVIGNDVKTAHMLIANNYGMALRIVPIDEGSVPCPSGKEYDHCKNVPSISPGDQPKGVEHLFRLYGAAV